MKTIAIGLVALLFTTVNTWDTTPSAVGVYLSDANIGSCKAF